MIGNEQSVTIRGFFREAIKDEQSSGMSDHANDCSDEMDLPLKGGTYA
jgi:hypothetical protein